MKYVFFFHIFFLTEHFECWQQTSNKISQGFSSIICISSISLYKGSRESNNRSIPNAHFVISKSNPMMAPFIPLSQWEVQMNNDTTGFGEEENEADFTTYIVMMQANWNPRIWNQLPKHRKLLSRMTDIFH